MVLNAGSLNRRIQIRRASSTTDEYGVTEFTWHDFGPVIFARRRDVSDAERFAADAWHNRLVTRFIIRASGYARSIARHDRLVHEGTTFEIDGIKEVPESRGFLEITAWADDVA